jgi:hypothetical protein
VQPEDVAIPVETRPGEVAQVETLRALVLLSLEARPLGRRSAPPC